MVSNAYRERLKSVAKDYAKLPHLKRQLNEKNVSSKINSIIYNDKKDFLIIEDSSSNNHVQILKASNNGAVDSWDGSGALEAVPGVTRSNYLNSTEVARFVSESDVKRAFGRKFKDIYKDTNLKVYGIRPGGMYSVGEDNIGRKVWCDVLIWYFRRLDIDPGRITTPGAMTGVRGEMLCTFNESGTLVTSCDNRYSKPDQTSVCEIINHTTDLKKWYNDTNAMNRVHNFMISWSRPSLRTLPTTKHHVYPGEGLNKINFAHSFKLELSAEHPVCTSLSKMITTLDDTYKFNVTTQI